MGTNVQKACREASRRHSTTNSQMHKRSSLLLSTVNSVRICPYGQQVTCIACLISQVAIGTRTPFYRCLFLSSHTPLLSRPTNHRHTFRKTRFPTSRLWPACTTLLLSPPPYFHASPHSLSLSAFRNHAHSSAYLCNYDNSHATHPTPTPADAHTTQIDRRSQSTNTMTRLLSYKKFKSFPASAPSSLESSTRPP